MEISALASGSSGNCFYVENKGKAILVDVGISCRQIEKRLERLGKKVENIKGVFITHEHSDHRKGCDVFARKYNVPIFATKKTDKNCLLCKDRDLINYIKNNEDLEVGNLKIKAFSKSHKAEDPISFTIANDKKISIITDLGKINKNVIGEIKDSDFLCIESNHSLKMLENGKYPYFLKKWIKSEAGHLSNKQASLAVLEHASSKLKYILLSHLSENNNTPQKALETFNILKERRDLNPKINISTRNPTEIFKVR